MTIMPRGRNREGIIEIRKGKDLESKRQTTGEKKKRERRLVVINRCYNVVIVEMNKYSCIVKEGWKWERNRLVSCNRAPGYAVSLRLVLC